MGSTPPAYFAYALGCCVSAGLGIPAAILYYYHNINTVVRDGDPARHFLNRLSLTAAILALASLASQSVFPMGDGNPIHIFFAVSFFSCTFVHILCTSTMYWMAGRLYERLKLKPNQLFWIRWKVLFAITTATFSLITILVLLFDMSGHWGDDWFEGPHYVSWMAADKSWLMVAGAGFEYLTCVSLICYFCSYFHDLAYVRLVIVSDI